MRTTLVSVLELISLIVPTTAGISVDSKRGTSYSFLTTNHELDYNLLLSNASPISWYYTWSFMQANLTVLNQTFNTGLEFVPTLHARENITDLPLLQQLPASSTHLFTFNEPDGDKPSGGSDISPDDAARLYVDHVVPLRPRWKISHPSVTGSERGLAWLNAFNASCYRLNPTDGCPTDFVVAHYYGDFVGLSWWVDQLAKWYGITKPDGSRGASNVTIWVKEFGIAQASPATAEAMLRETMAYFDKLDYLAKYAWFGVFRPQDANKWTGAGLSMFDNEGGLTPVGNLYLGGEQHGFKQGDRGQPIASMPSPPPGSPSSGAPTPTPGTPNVGCRQRHPWAMVRLLAVIAVWSFQ